MDRGDPGGVGGYKGQVSFCSADRKRELCSCSSLSYSKIRCYSTKSVIEGVVQVKENTDLRVFKTIHIGDFVISLRSFQGGFEFSNYEGVCSPAYQVFHATKDLSNDFFRYLFKSDGFISKINGLTVGIREGKNIQYWDFSNMLLALPPKEVQIRSAQYLNAKCTEIDTMLSKTRSSIEEYKKLKPMIEE